jgi:hypothetical protein
MLTKCPSPQSAGKKKRDPVYGCANSRLMAARTMARVCAPLFVSGKRIVNQHSIGTRIDALGDLPRTIFARLIAGTGLMTEAPECRRKNLDLNA